MTPPLGKKRILGIDPGYRTGCKLVCIDTEGNLVVEMNKENSHKDDKKEAYNAGDYSAHGISPALLSPFVKR